ncbi:MAG: hypothetical protein NUV47_00245 [Patescibacteria group bacterium]|nr:hypothetical protein [Patescibacteria group bacterium]
MQKLAKLVIGDTVALITPAGMPPERFRHYIPLMEEYVQKEGFRTKTYLSSEQSSDQELAELFYYIA